MYRKTFLLVFIAFLATTFISMLYNNVPILLYIAGIRRVIIFIIFGMALSRLDLSTTHLLNFLSLIVIILLIEPAVAITEFITYYAGLNPADVSLLDSAIGTFSKKNGSATITLFIIFLFYYFYYQDRRILTKKNGYFLTAFILAFSGGSYYLFAFTLIVMSILFKDVFKFRKQIVLVTTLAFVLLLIYSYSETTAKYFDFKNIYNLHSQYWVGSGRFGDVAAIVVSYNEISAEGYTFLFGLGPGMFSETKISDIVSSSVKYFTMEGTLPTNENSLSLFLAEFGIIGTSLYLIMSLIVLIRVYKIYRSTNEILIKAYSFGYVALGLAMIFGIAYRSYFVSFPESFFFWGVPAILYNIERRQNKHIDVLRNTEG